jgi:predicted PurR-regulated permease PerM
MVGVAVGGRHGELTLAQPLVVEKGRRVVIRGRRRQHQERGEHARVNGDGVDGEIIDIEPGELARVFSAPRWLRDLGRMSWLLVGVGAFLIGAIWLLALTQTIVLPVVAATIIAAVLSPVMGWLERRRVGRGLGTAIVLVGLVALASLIVVAVVAGISSETDDLTSSLQSAADEIEGWLTDLGVSQSSAAAAKEDASTSVSDAFHALIDGVSAGIGALAGLVTFLSFTALSLVFLLKDGPAIRTWGEHRLGVPLSVAHTTVGRVISSLRGYFAGVTVVAAFNAIVIGLGALVLGVPLPGSIAVINFLAAYIPYLGAWTAGIFTGLIALGAEGPETALAMGVVILLANGILQQIVQPIAYGATLGIHPLAVLIVTIAAGSLFGTVGLVLAAPLTAAATRISADLARARAKAEQAQNGSDPRPEPGRGELDDAATAAG